MDGPDEYGQNIYEPSTQASLQVSEISVACCIRVAHIPFVLFFWYYRKYPLQELCISGMSYFGQFYRPLAHPKPARKEMKTKLSDLTEIYVFLDKTKTTMPYETYESLETTEKQTTRDTCDLGIRS